MGDPARGSRGVESGTPRIGMVGSGLMAGVHLEAWRALGHTGVIHSVAPDVDQVAARHDWPVAASFDELVSTVDVVDICAPTDLHAELALAAIGAGRHVICEKPLALTVADGRRVIDAATAAGVQLHVGQVVRFFPEYARARAAVDEGRIGRPAVLRLSRRTARPTSPWFSDSAVSGGLLVDQMIHDYDIARWIAGEVTSVYARQVTSPDGATTAYVVLTHDSGALSHVQGAWGRPGTRFATSFTLSGSTGRIDHDSTAAKALRWELAAADGERPLLPAEGGDSPYQAELDAFSRSIRGGPPPPVTPDDALEALRIALAAARSAGSGRPVAPEDVA